MTKDETGTAPHCDQSVLHAPGDCEYCDTHPDWQALRNIWGICFTGQEPDKFRVPCPSDQRRGLGHAHTWAGNRPTNVDTEQEQSAASRAMYGER